MNWETILTGFVALYGAILSTIIGIRELKKEKRSLLIILEHVAFYERVNVRIVNSGVRPVTIIDIGMDIFEGANETNPPHWEMVRAGAVLDKEKELNPLPARIEDGEQKVLLLSEMVSHILISNHMVSKVRVYDAEGNIYTKFKSMEVDPKWGTHTTLK